MVINLFKKIWARKIKLKTKNYEDKKDSKLVRKRKDRRKN